jgi:MPBQ/MSBQ methyltransferase
VTLLASDARATNAYWGRSDLERAIDEALVGIGKNLNALTIDDLAPVDQFHGGGKASTDRLARLAVEHGCVVTVVDLTESYVRTGQWLTTRLGLTDRVSHRVGDALALDMGAATFDVVWTQNSGMNIADKERLYAGFARLLPRGGQLVIQEPMAGPTQPAIFPVVWAKDATTSFLRTPMKMRALIEAAGFRALAWEDVTAELAGPSSGAAVPAHSIARIVMGDTIDEITRAGQRNRDEGRIVNTQAVFERQ